MQPIPRIFVSATSRDLRTARIFVSEGLRRMECLPIVQDDFPPDHKTVREMLVAKIKTCDAVVHLSGFYYGAEPQPHPAESERRSFTQMEYEIAMELGLPCYVFLCGEKFPFDDHEPESEEKRALQLAHRQRLLSRDELFYEFDTREDLNSRTRELQLSVDALREELVKERKRRRITLFVSVVALLVALVGGGLLYSKTQKQGSEIAATAKRVDEQGRLIAMLLAEQERLRARGTGGETLSEEAKENVAVRESLSQVDLRFAITKEITEAEIAAAGASGKAKAVALKRLADAQLAAGMKNEALVSYRARLELLDRSEDTLEWAGAVASVADLLFFRDYGPEGPEMVREALVWVEKNEKVETGLPAGLRLRESLRQFVFIEGDYETAIEMGKEIQAFRDKVSGKDAAESLAAAGYLGRHLRANGDFEEADVIFQRIIETSERLYGANDMRTLHARWDLAGSLERQKRFVEAEGIYEDLIARAGGHSNAGDPDVLGLRASMAFLKEAGGRDEQAMEIWRTLLDDARKYNDPDSKVVQDYTNILAVRELGDGNYVKAEKLSRELYDSRVRTIGANQLETVDSLKLLASVYEQSGDMSRYEEIMYKVIAGKIKVFGPDSEEVANDLYQFAISLAAEGKLNTGLAQAESCFELRKRVLGAANPKTIEAIVIVQTIANRTEDWALAARKGTEAMELLQAADEVNSEVYAMVAYRLAVAKEELSENESALALARHARRLAEQYSDDNHWLHPRTEEMISRLK